MKIFKIIGMTFIFISLVFTCAFAELNVESDGSPDIVIFDGKTELFSDVSVDDWFYDDVNYVYNNKIMSGTGDKIFSPYEKFTRSMMITMIYRMAGEPECSENVFSDVEKGSWYDKASAWGAENKIVSGTGNNMFSPMQSISREQLAVMLYNYAKKDILDNDKFEITGFDDINNISSWAEEGMAWAVSTGLINGKSSTQIAPNDGATRAEAAAIIRRYVTSTEK